MVFSDIADDDSSEEEVSSSKAIRFAIIIIVFFFCISIFDPLFSCVYVSLPFLNVRIYLLFVSRSAH